MAFTLKSGNSPKFKNLGSSPANMNNFGLSAGDSPYRQDDGADNTESEEVNVTETDSDGVKENIVKPLPKVNKSKTTASKIGNTLLGAFTTGLSRVYGGDGVIAENKVKFYDPKKKKEEKEFGKTALDDD